MEIDHGPKDDYSHSIYTLERVSRVLQVYNHQAYHDQHSSSQTIPWLTEAIKTLKIYLGVNFCQAFKHITP